MTATSRCPFPDRDRLATLDAAGRLEGADLARWDVHLASCPACAERAAKDAVTDAVLSEVAAEDLAGGTARRATPSSDEPRRRTRWALALAAAAALVLAWPLVSPALAPRDRGSPVDGRRAQAFRDALARTESGRHEEALAAYRALLAGRPEYGVKFLEGHALLHTGRAEDAAAAFRAALAMGVAPNPDGTTTEAWYVRGHLAQALVAAGPDGRYDAEVERIVREQMQAPGTVGSLNRCLVWTLLARARAFGRGDVAGGEAALAEAEHENRLHQREALRAGRDDVDCHYMLQARFAFAQAVRADSESGRRAAADLRAMNERTSERAPDLSRTESFLAEAVEYEALAELLAARRGDAADLGKARRLLAEALAHRRKAENPEGLARTRARTAWLDLLEGRPGDAVAAAEAAETDAVRSGTPDERFDARLVRAQALAALGRREDALAAVGVARATPGAGEAGRELALAAVEVQAATDPASVARARAAIAAATSSPLRDVARVAARVLGASAKGASTPIGPQDLGFAP